MSKRSSSNAFAGEARNDHRSESGYRSPKNTDNSQCYGKFVSSSHSHSDRWSSEPPTAVTPNKEDRASSKHKKKSALPSSIALRKEPFDTSEVSKSNKRDYASYHKSTSALPPSNALQNTPFNPSNESKSDLTSKSSHKKQHQNIINSRKSAKSVPITTLSCIAIDWLTPSIVHTELLKHISDDESFPKSTEDQLDLLMNKFPLPELKSAYYMTMGKLGADVKSETLPFNAWTEAVKEAFIAMIYDHRSMMYDGLNSRGPEHR
jgi:hypothetical protein